MDQGPGQGGPEQQDQEDAQHEEPGVGEAHRDGGGLPRAPWERTGRWEAGPVSGSRVERKWSATTPARDDSGSQEEQGSEEDQARLPVSGGSTTLRTAWAAPASVTTCV